MKVPVVKTLMSAVWVSFKHTISVKTIQGRCGMGSCRNHVGTYKCSGMCPMGYNGFRGRCMDINECARNPCLSGKNCRNTRGGYTCTCGG